MTGDVEKLRNNLLARELPDVRDTETTAAIVGQVYANPTVPTTGNKFFSFKPVNVTGAETEGGAGTFTLGSLGYLAYVIGSQAPVAGDNLITRFVGNRWVAEHGSATVAALPGFSGCGCAYLPARISMTVVNGSLAGNLFISDTLVYQATPSGYAGGVGAFGWWGQTLYNPYSGYTGQQRLFCSSGVYSVGFYYWASGSTPATGTLDSNGPSWILGLSGNTCTPSFNLPQVTGYPSGVTSPWNVALS